MRSRNRLSAGRLPSVALAISLATGPVAAAENGHDEVDHALPHSHLSVMLGYALERKRGKNEEARAIGLDYSYRYHENWSVAGFIEELGKDTSRDFSVGVLINYHPAPGWALFAGPGYEFTEKHDEALFRIGAGYNFSLPNRWTLGPRLMYDMIEGGKRTFILGVAIGREF